MPRLCSVCPKLNLDRKMRVGKLDSALLFLSSTIGIIFAIIRVVTPSYVGILSSIPLMLFGVISPFYYDYVQGAIVHNSAIDRVRGWIFFLIGLGSYLYNLGRAWLQSFLNPTLGPISSPAIPAIIGGTVYILVGARYGHKFQDFIFGIVGERRSVATNKAAIYCASAAFFFAFGIAGLNLQLQNYYSYAVPVLIPLAFGAFALSKSEPYVAQSRMG